MDDQMLVDKARRGYFRRVGEHGDIPGKESTVHEWDGEWYVVLENIRGPLAIYLVVDQFAGRVKFLDPKDWPAGLVRQWTEDDDE